MAKWKKIIVSGSDAELNHITGSGQLKFPNLNSTESLLLKPLVIDSNGIIYKGTGSVSSSYAITSSHALTASYVSPDSIDGQVGFPYSGSDIITSNDNSAAVITGSLFLSGSGNITASGNILANAFFISESGTKLADVSNSTIRLGDDDLKLDISASSLNINASGGITASVVPQVESPPYVLAQLTNDEVVKIPLASLGSSGGSNSVNNNVIDNLTSCNDNINITTTTTATSEIEILIGSIIINDVAGGTTYSNPGGGTSTVDTNQFIFVPFEGYTSGSVNSGSKVRIKNNASEAIPGQSNLSADFEIEGIYAPASSDEGSDTFISAVDTGMGGADETFDIPNNRIVSKFLHYPQYHSASLNGSLNSKDILEEAQYFGNTVGSDKYRSNLVYQLFLIQEQSTSNIVICLDDDLSVNDITQSGDLYFEASESMSLNGIVTESVHTISYYGYEEGPGTGSLQITASSIVVSGNLEVKNNVDIGGTLSFDGFTFSDGDILVTSGSTTFGSGSGNKHEFTGSIFTSGSITLGATDKLIGTASYAEDAESSSYAATASYISAADIDGQVGFPYSGSDLIGTVGTPDAAVITGSLILTTGFSGSGNITASGNISASGNIIATSFTGSLFGSASYAVTASHIITASYAITASNVITASYAVTASNVITASYSISSSQAESSSYAATASYISSDSIDGQVGFPYSGSDFIGVSGTPDAAVITGSLILQSGVSASGNITASGTISASGDVITTNLEVKTITASSDISASGNLTAKDATLSGNLIVHGNMIVSGTQTTIHTENLAIEDRFIILGSGSKSSANVDVGIIFDSGSVDGLGMGLFYDNSANRLAVGKDLGDVLLSNPDSNYEIGNPNVYPDAQNPLDMGIVAGNIMTIRSTGSVGSTWNTGSDVQFGKGEMGIDENDDVWIYV